MAAEDRALPALARSGSAAVAGVVAGVAGVAGAVAGAVAGVVGAPSLGVRPTARSTASCSADLSSFRSDDAGSGGAAAGVFVPKGWALGQSGLGDRPPSPLFPLLPSPPRIPPSSGPTGILWSY